MKLVASMIVGRVEPGRYLEPCVNHLLEFCDEVVLLLDGADDWPTNFIHANSWENEPVAVFRSRRSFFEHEGRARQELLERTLESGPSHVLAIDADEFVADGAAVRAACMGDDVAWQLCMQEVWNAYKPGLELRQDGGWAEHDVTILWDVLRAPQPLRIADRALACGRVPLGLTGSRSGHTGTSVLHLGWANRAERAERHARYVQHDGGRFHASAHLDSIMLPDEQIQLSERPWPPGFTNRRVAAILDHAGKV